MAWKTRAILVALAWLLSLPAVSADPTSPVFRPWEQPRKNWQPTQRSQPPMGQPNQPYYAPGWPAMQSPNYSQPPYYGNNRNTGEQPPRLEVELSDLEPMVQQNLLLRLRVISQSNLKTATPKFPQIDSVIFQSIDGPKASTRNRRGRREIINEFVYQVTPLRDGRIEIPVIEVNGSVKGGRGDTYQALSAQPLVLQVKPAQPGVKPWLPLEKLTLNSHWADDGPASAGQPVTLTVELRAVGASGNQLPSVEGQLQNPAFRVYREDSKTITELSKDGDQILGRRVDSFTLVPQHGGDLGLPELRVPWWDIKAGQNRIAGGAANLLAVRGGVAPAPASRDESSSGMISKSGMAFWIILAIAYGVVMGYWFAAWRVNPDNRDKVQAAFAPVRRALRHQFVGMAPAFAPLGIKFRNTAACLNPITRWQRVRRQMITMLPLSIRFWFCVRCVDQENDPEIWGYTLRFLAGKHLDLPPRAPFPEIAERIIAFQPGADPERVRGLIMELDRGVYGRQAMDFERWKRDFRRAIRPHPLALRFSLPAFRRAGKASMSLPSLNPGMA